MSDELPTVSLVVLNYNGREMLSPCFESLEKLEYPADRLELVLCDNGSEDGSVDHVRATHPSVRILELDRNWGFEIANNRAAEFATGELVGFLNNDMRLDSRWLIELVRATAEHGAPCVSSKIFNWDGSRIDYVGAGANFQGYGYQHDHGKPESRFDYARRVLSPCAGAMLIRRDLFIEVGGFDELFFTYYEDTDLGWRLNVLGHDVWYVPEAIAYHHHHGYWGGQPNGPRRFLYERNALCTMFKNLDDENLAAALPATLLLINEKSLQYGRVDRASVRPDLELPAPEPPLPPLRDRILRALREGGIAGLPGRAGAFAGRRLRRGRDAWAARRRPKEPPPDPLLPLACQVAISEFARNLESLQARRAWVQSRRVRSDAEVLPLLHWALEPSYFEEPYVEFHRGLVKALRLEDRFAAGHLHRPE